MRELLTDWRVLIALICGISFLVYLSSDRGRYSSGTFHGYSCTKDCSGHKAGYAWAERKGITDPDDCGGKSQSFIKGCRAYAEELF